jgi:hypothetical protein
MGWPGGRASGRFGWVVTEVASPASGVGEPISGSGSTYTIPASIKSGPRCSRWVPGGALPRDPVSGVDGTPSGPPASGAFIAWGPAAGDGAGGPAAGARAGSSPGRSALRRSERVPASPAGAGSVVNQPAASGPLGVCCDRAAAPSSVTAAPANPVWPASSPGSAAGEDPVGAPGAARPPGRVMAARSFVDPASVAAPVV